MTFFQLTYKAFIRELQRSVELYPRAEAAPSLLIFTWYQCTEPPSSATLYWRLWQWQLTFLHWLIHWSADRIPRKQASVQLTGRRLTLWGILSVQCFLDRSIAYVLPRYTCATAPVFGHTKKLHEYFAAFFRTNLWFKPHNIFRPESRNYSSPVVVTTSATFFNLTQVTFMVTPLDS